MTRVLLVEDEPDLADPLAYLLQREGFEVEIVDDGEKALRVFREQGADVVLLDLMLPGIPGTEVCRQMRMTSQVPIVMLTAKDSEVDIVVGLELGADDYVTKPYSSRELLARMRAVLRRSASADGDLEEHVLEGGRVTLDIDRHTIAVDGEQINMPLKEFELLELLMRNTGRVLTRGQLIDRVWGSDYFGDTKTLDVHIKRIRSRIEETPSAPTGAHASALSAGSFGARSAYSVRQLSSTGTSSSTASASPGWKNMLMVDPGSTSRSEIRYGSSFDPRLTVSPAGTSNDASPVPQSTESVCASALVFASTATRLPSAPSRSATTSALRTSRPPSASLGRFTPSDAVYSNVVA